MKELPFGQITPVAKPIGAFATPAKRNVAGAAKPTLLGDTQKIVRQQMMGVGSYQGYNQWQELSTALGNVGAQVPKFGESLISAMAAENESIGTREAYKAAQNQTAKAMISLQNQNELAAGNSGAAVNSLARIDPIGADLAETTNPWRLIGRRKVMAQLAAYEINDILDKDLQDNAEYLSTLGEGHPELMRRKSSLTRQIQKKYGLTGDEPEYHKYVVGELNKAWDKYREQQSKLYDFELKKNVTNGTVAQVKTLMEGYVKNGVTDTEGNVYMPGSAKWTEIAGIALTSAIDKQLSVLAGKQREDVWKAIREEIIPTYNNEVTSSVIREIRLGSARDQWEKRPKLGDGMPATSVSLLAEGLRDQEQVYQSREKAFERRGTELWYGPDGPGRFTVGTQEYKDAVEAWSNNPELEGWRGKQEFSVKLGETEEKYEKRFEAKDPVELAIDEANFIDSLTPDVMKQGKSVLYREAAEIANSYPAGERTAAITRLMEAIDDKEELYSKIPRGVTQNVRDEVAQDLQDKEILKLDKTKNYLGGLRLGLDQDAAIGRSGTEFKNYANNLKDGYTNAITEAFLEWRDKNPGKEPTPSQQTAIIRRAVNAYRNSDERKQLRNQALGLNEKGEKPIPEGGPTTPPLPKLDRERGDPGERKPSPNIRDTGGPLNKDGAAGFSDRRVRLFRMQPLMKATWLVDELTNVQQGNSYSAELKNMAKRAKVHPDRVLLEQLKFYDKALDPEGKIKSFLQNRINNRNNSQKVSASHIQGKGNWLANMFFGGPVAAATLDQMPQPPVLIADRYDGRGLSPVKTKERTDILDLIHSKESTVDKKFGGYEAINQGGKDDGKTPLGFQGTYGDHPANKGKKITDLTIEQIMAIHREGDDTKKYPFTPEGWKKWYATGKFHAVGRYQFVGIGLREAVRLSGIDVKTKFTPEVQDKLALHLALTHGADQWTSFKKKDHPNDNKKLQDMIEKYKKPEMQDGQEIAMHDYQKDPYLRKTIMEIINTPGYDPDTVKEAQRQLLRMNQGLPRFPKV